MARFACVPGSHKRNFKPPDNTEPGYPEAQVLRGDGLGGAQAKHCLNALCASLSSSLRHDLSLCLDCFRGQDTAFALCASTAFVSTVVHLPCAATPFAAKTPPLPRGPQPISARDGPPTIANLCPAAGSVVIFTECLRHAGPAVG